MYSNSIFWVDTDKIKPNPFQPRRDFDEARLQDLADSIRQYGVLQPLTVSRVEREKEGGGLVTEYELIAGERRLRAAILARVSQVPVIIREGDTSLMKLELAIIENLQREDLNVVDRARAFFRLVNEFKFTHNEVARKIAYDRVRKKEFMPDPEIIELEEEFQEKLGTRVHIDRKELGGQIKIDYFSTEDLREILNLIHKVGVDKKPAEMLENYVASLPTQEENKKEEAPIDDRTEEQKKEDDT